MTLQLATLSNGLTVITDHNADIESAALGLWVKVGSRHESSTINGISHLLEHMAFRGTTSQSALDIVQKIESVGGYLNAYTSREATAYYARVLHKDIPLAASILTDILQHSTFEETELEKERAVILQEISQTQDAPDDLVFEGFQENAYPGQSYGRPIAGRSEIVSRLNRQDIQQYIDDHYTIDKMVFAAAGKVDHQALIDQLEADFKLQTAPTQQMPEAARYQGGDFRLVKDLEQVHIVLGFEGVPLHSSDYYTASILSALLGGGMSSRLFQEVREKRGLAYSIQSFAQSASDTGIFGVYTSTSPKEVEQMMPVISDVLKTAADTLTETEITRAKNQLKASLFMSLESTSSRCQQLAQQMMVYGRPLSAQEIVTRIDAIQATDLSRLATQLFSSTPTLAAVGPVQDIMSYDQLKNYLV